MGKFTVKWMGKIVAFSCILLFVLALNLALNRGVNMSLALSLGIVIIIAIVALVSTLSIAGKGDEDYSNSYKRNTANLTWIYVVVIIASLIAVGVYIRWFA